MRLTRKRLNKLLWKWSLVGPAYVRRFLHGCPHIDPEDIVADTILRVYYYVGKVVHHPEALLCRIARSLLSNHRRRRQHVSLPYPDAIVNYRRSEAEERLAAREARIALEGVFKECIPSVRRLMEAMLLEDDPEELALRLATADGIARPDAEDIHRMKRRMHTYLARARACVEGPNRAA